MTKYGCVMLLAPIPNWADICTIIDEKDVYNPDGKHGVTVNPHITVLYGLHKVTPMQLMMHLDDNWRPVDVVFEGLSTFDSEEYDVLKFGVRCEALHGYNDSIQKAFECTITHPEYHPHLTLSYIKKGTKDKYLSLGTSLSPMRLSMMQYSSADGRKIMLNMPNG